MSNPHIEKIHKKALKKYKGIEIPNKPPIVDQTAPVNKSIEEWEAQYREEGESNHYSKEDIERYGEIIQFIKNYHKFIYIYNIGLNFNLILFNVKIIKTP